MADNQDDSQKTEEPTQKRLQDSRKKGQVATSREINHWFIILAGALLVTVLAPGMMGDIRDSLAGFLQYAHQIRIADGELERLIPDVLANVGTALMLPLGLLVVAALLAGLVQHGPMIAPKLIQPKLEKISVTKGFKRLFSLRALTEFTKGVLKLAIVGSVAAFLMVPAFDSLTLFTTIEPGALLGSLQGLALRMMIGVIAVMTVIAGLDFLYQKFEHHKKMRMSRQELKDELKESEGGPIIRSRLRQIRAERARRRMMAAVPEADVVITNPVHYAVALSYQPESMEAPTLVAKGADSLAIRIRTVAEEHEIPVVENPPLARALHDGVELDQEIPSEHYRAVAEVIGYVMRLKKRVIHA